MSEPMTARPHLSRAPILEAVIDIRVEPRGDLQVPELSAMHDLLGKDAFPDVAKQSTFSGTLQVAEQALSINPKQELGFAFRSSDELHVIQAQKMRFSVSRLPPYDRWSQLLSEAKARWQQYVAIAKPVSVTRIGVRFINRIELPTPMGHFQDWFPAFPDIPAGLPQSLSEMFLRMVIPVPSIEGAAVVTQAVEPRGTEHVAVILDIDVFRMMSLPVDSAGIWTALEQLRDVKNEFFFANVSAQTVEMLR